MTARLLLALTALYVQRSTHTAEEQRQYSELALRLIDKAEAATRTAVSGILQRHPDAPAEVVERLAGRDSAFNGDPKGEPRSTQDQHRTGNRLFESNRYMADGQRASTPPRYEAPAVQQPPPPYPPPHAGEGREGAFGEAFFAASPAERRRLLSLIARGCGDDVQAIPDDSGRIHGTVDVAALHGRIGEFTREFERLVDIPKSLCERILNDPSGEPMVVAAKAVGMPIAILQRILLLVSPAASHSVQRVYELTELYHGLDGRVARDLLAQWRTQAKPSDPIPQMGPHTVDSRPGTPRTTSVASLRSRFGALTERLQSQAVNARRDRGNVARCGLRSR